MITNLNKEKWDQTNVYPDNSMKLLSNKYCHRCGGLMISEHCFEVDSHTGEFEILIRKCLTCGESIDPTILRNRFQTQQILHSHIPSTESGFCRSDKAEGTAEDH